MVPSLRKHRPARRPLLPSSPAARRCGRTPHLLPTGQPGPSPAPRLLPRHRASASPALTPNKMAPLAPSRPMAAPTANQLPAYQSSARAPRAPPPRKARETVRALRRRPAGLGEPEGVGWSSSPSSAKSTSNSPVLLQLAWFHSSPIQQELTPP